MGRVWLGRVGLGLGRIGVSNADSDFFNDFFSNRQHLVFESATESATGAKIGYVSVG